MSRQFTTTQWKSINLLLDQSPTASGFPARRYDSAVIGSFNIRNLGNQESRSHDTWAFLARIIKAYDLIAIQEVKDDISGINYLMELLGSEFGLLISDTTGAAPGASGTRERLAFIYRWSVVRRAKIVSDVTYDRSYVINTILEHMDELLEAKADFESEMARYQSGDRSTEPNIKMPCFLSFIRQPFMAAFQIMGHPGTTPYEFMAVNAHLHYGDFVSDRRMEFEALMDWIRERVVASTRVYYPNFILLGDLNLDYDNPGPDRSRMESRLKSLNNDAGEAVHVNFPFLDVHPSQTEVYRTNSRRSETFDHIGLFFREERWPRFDQNSHMGADPAGPDYGVFDFCGLFAAALYQKPFAELKSSQQDALIRRFEFSVSDHLPLWLRLPLPTT